jgi:UDP-N-acetylmuramoylalanine--D-glutamate ligase
MGAAGFAVQTFGQDVPRRAGDLGLQSVNGMSWLVRALDPEDGPSKRRADRVAMDSADLLMQRLMPADALRIRGRHNATNALAALALAQFAGASLASMLYGLREYRGEPHRLESLAVIADVEYFDDSKGTNVGATVAALQGLGPERKLVLILGGDGKGQDFAPLAAPVHQYARAVLLIGRDAQALRHALSGTGVPLQDATGLQAAVAQAHTLARAGDAVVLSPACSSLDMFDNYQHRARVFAQAVQELAALEGVA